ncbi:Gfo/Idh/MocA family protein [Pseudochelatococcus sp. B33]
MLNAMVEVIGRRLRVGVVGGGEGSLIGAAHRVAMRFDDRYEIVAGVLSSNSGKALEQGRALGIPRAYGSLGEMLSAEKAREDGADIIAIMTPNDSHVSASIAALDAGYHVICDKPVANDLAGAKALAARVRASGRHFLVTYNYTGYPMVRQAREMIAAGDIGEPHLVEVRYAQGNLSMPVERGVLSRQLEWRLDPVKGGVNNLLLDIGTHAHHLATYVTGRAFESVYADIGPALPGRRFDDTAVILGRLAGGLRIALSVTKAATGAPQVFGIEVYGGKGGIRWEQGLPNALSVTRQDGPVEIYGRATAGLMPLAARSLRIPLHHPEGFREGFANIYANFADVVAATIAGVAPPPEVLGYPGIADGVAGLAWVEACVRSREEGRWIAVENAAADAAETPP